MVRGWWWIRDPEELYNTLQALHPRGVREKVLHKHLAKHMESLAEMCTKPISGECRVRASELCSVHALTHHAESFPSSCLSPLCVMITSVVAFFLARPDI